MSTSQDKLKLLLVALCAIGTILILYSLLRYAYYGFDFTDESFYLVWIANPFLYEGSLTQFGFVYYPIYKMLGGDIAALRQANILITFSLAWSLVYYYLASFDVGFKEGRNTLLAISASLATSALIFFDNWLPTPSYNSLNLQALLITANGLVLVEKISDRASIIGSILMGIGGWLAIMAKPSTAIVLAVGVFVFLLISRKFSIRMLAITLATAVVLLLISALLIDGSVVNFIRRIQLGIDFSKALGGGHTVRGIIRIDDFQLNNNLKNAIFMIFVALSIALWSFNAKNKKWLFVGMLISVAFFLINALLSLGQFRQTMGFGTFQGFLIFGLFYSMILTALKIGRIQTIKSITVQYLPIVGIFLLMPLIYAFGTANNYWQSGGSVAIFWLLAGLPLLAPLIRQRASWLLAFPFALAAQTVTAALLQTGFEQPYRQTQPLRLNSSNLEIGYQRSTLTLSEGYSGYLATVMEASKKIKFEKNTPMIDLSGQSPGALYAIGAQNLGQAWIIGGYPGSLKLAELTLSYVSCEQISLAWILFEPDGPRSIPLELMSLIGADFPSSYSLELTFKTAEGMGGYSNQRTQNLYKPVEPHKTRMNCQRLREKQK